VQFLSNLYNKIVNLEINSITNTEALNLFISANSLLVSLFSLLVALIVLGYAAYQFALKRGVKFVGMYATSTSVWSKQPYVAEVIIENAKDKAVAVSAIYLRIDRNIYLEIINYSDSPKIINPFETIKISFQEGVSGYIASTYKVDLSSLLSNRKIPKNIVVATPQGLSVVKRYKTLWNVYFASLKNNFIIPVRPVKKVRAGTYYPDTLMYVLIDRCDAEPVEHFLFRGREYEISGIKIVVDEFKDKDQLQQHLINSGWWQNAFEVESVDYEFKDYEKYKEVSIPNHGFFATLIIGKAYTKFRRLAFKLENRPKRK